MSWMGPRLVEVWWSAMTSDGKSVNRQKVPKSRAEKAEFYGSIDKCERRSDKPGDGGLDAYLTTSSTKRRFCADSLSFYKNFLAEASRRAD
jgi:hypothetical protein